MVDLLNRKYFLFINDDEIKILDEPQSKQKRLIKDNIYCKMPIGIRVLVYFVYRFIFRLGFLGGGKGFVFHFMQGLWYRMLVDVKIMEIEVKSKGDVGKIRELLESDYDIQL